MNCTWNLVEPSLTIAYLFYLSCMSEWLASIFCHNLKQINKQNKMELIWYIETMLLPKRARKSNFHRNRLIYEIPISKSENSTKIPLTNILVVCLFLSLIHINFREFHIFIATVVFYLNILILQTQRSDEEGYISLQFFGRFFSKISFLNLRRGIRLTC